MSIIADDIIFIFLVWQETTGRAKQRTRLTDQRSWKTISLGSSRCSIHSPSIHYHQGFTLLFFYKLPHFTDAHILLSRDRWFNFSVSLQLLVWYSSWVWRYKFKKAPYSWEDASYLTRRSLGVSADAWANLGILLFSYVLFSKTYGWRLISDTVWLIFRWI